MEATTGWLVVDDQGIVAVHEEQRCMKSVCIHKSADKGAPKVCFVSNGLTLDRKSKYLEAKGRRSVLVEFAQSIPHSRLQGKNGYGKTIVARIYISCEALMV
jgi:hypothetical protein